MKKFNSLAEMKEHLNKLEKELKSLKETIGTYKEEPKEWKPKKGEFFYVINQFNKVGGWYNNDSYASEFIKCGNCFRTREKAEEKARQMRKILQEDE